MVRSIRKHLVSLNRKICKRLAIAGLFRDHCRNVSHGLGYVYSVVVVVAVVEVVVVVLVMLWLVVVVMLWLVVYCCEWEWVSRPLGSQPVQQGE